MRLRINRISAMYFACVVAFGFAIFAPVTVVADETPVALTARVSEGADAGADAAPYFRIFNPVTQGKKFDPQGEYIRRFIPELAKLPDKYLFAPWETPPAILQQCGVRLGENYPEPVVDLKHSRERALEAFQSLKNQ